MKTTEYYGMAKKNYKTSAGLGFTKLVIFDGSSWTSYLRNDKTGYCKNVFTEKRISKAEFEKLEKTCKRAF